MIERLLTALGAFVGLLAAGLLARGVGGLAGLDPWLVAPLGASAVLVFALPASPLAQPWPVLGGNTVSTLVGIACVYLVGEPVVAAALAVAGAILVMSLLRCLHPPGGASALLAVLTGATDPTFALFPVALNSLCLVLAGIAFHSLAGRRYPLPRQVGD